MSKYKLEIKWAILFTLAALIWVVFERMMGWHGDKIEMHPVMTNIFAVVAISIFVFALRAKKQQLGGSISWKEAFMSGLIISVIVMLLTPLSQYITHNFISPDYFQNAIEYSVESGNATQEEAESFFNLKSYLMQASIGALVMGAITSAIVALFVKSK